MKKKFLLISVLGLLVLLALYVGISQGMGEKPKVIETKSPLTSKEKLLRSLGTQVPKEESKAQNFTLTDLSGKKVSLSHQRGKIVFLNFWASWCPSCRKEMPSMEKLYQKFKGKDFEMLAVDLREPKKQIESFIKKLKLTFPVLLDKDGRVGTGYQVSAIPTTYLINRKGKVIGRAVGARDWASEDAFNLIKTLIEE